MRATMLFWWLPEEESNFLDYLLTTGDVRALPFEAVPDRDNLMPRGLEEFIRERSPRHLFMGLQQHLNPIQISQLFDVANGVKIDAPYYRVDDIRSCVVGYGRGQLTADGNLTPFHLYAHWDYSDEEAKRSISKPRGFMDWGKEILHWAKKACPSWHQYKNYRISKSVKSALETGSVKIAPY